MWSVIFFLYLILDGFTSTAYMQTETLYDGGQTYAWVKCFTEFHLFTTLKFIFKINFCYQFVFGIQMTII